MGNFRKLRVWEEAKDLAIEIYNQTGNHSSFGRDFRFRDQIRSAAVSIASNIAEGDELDTNKQSIRHFYISKGSNAELITQLIIAKEIGYLDTSSFNNLISRCNHISVMLTKLIRARSS